jgi:hypothetical protein
MIYGFSYKVTKTTNAAQLPVMSVDINIQFKLYDEVMDLRVLDGFEIPVQTALNAKWSLGSGEYLLILSHFQENTASIQVNDFR